MPRHYEVLFLPWAPLDWESIGSSLRVGQVEFQPFSAFEAEPKVRQFLERYFNRYRDLYDKPVETITLCHYCPEERNYLQPTTEEEFREVGNTVNLILFCAVWDYLREAIGKGWTLLPPPNAETFELMGQRFTDDTLEAESPMIGLFAHGLRHIEELEKLRFSIPLNAHMRVKVRLNLPLLEQLQKVFADDFDGNERRRILRSLDWFRLAHRKDQSIEVQTVCMATALETLFPPPKQNETAKTLADAVDNWIRSRWTSVVELQRPDKKGQTIARTAAGFWMWDFYNLRSDIVHGKAISPEEFSVELPPAPHDNRPIRLPKVDVASFLYGALLIHQKIRAICLPEDAYDTESVPEDLRELFEDLYKDYYWKMDDCLERLGWTQPPRVSYDPQRASAVREYLARTLGDALQELSSKSIVEDRKRMRPKPFKEETTKG